MAHGAVEQARPSGVAELRFVGLPRVVAGRGEIRHAALRHLLDRMGDDAVLEHGLGEIDDVVDDHVRAVVGELHDAVREVRLALERGVERLLRTRRDVVDDLHHRAALVEQSSLGTGLRSFSTLMPAGRSPLRHVFRGAGEFWPTSKGPRRAIEAVGQHADLHAAAVHAELRARAIAAQGAIALRRGQSTARCRERRPQNLQAGRRADVSQMPKPVHARRPRARRPSR